MMAGVVTTVLVVAVDVGMSVVVSATNEISCEVVIVTSDVVLCPVAMPVPIGSCVREVGGSGRFVCVNCTTTLVDMGMIM